MNYHWIFTLGSKVCVWTGALAAPVWPQSPCNIDEAWNMGYIVVGACAVMAVFAIYRRLDSWHSYYRR